MSLPGGSYIWLLALSFMLNAPAHKSPKPIPLLNDESEISTGDSV